MKKEDEIYCPECGKAIKKNAKFCSNCGAKVGVISIESPGKLTNPIEKEISKEKNKSVKTKTSAVVLAVLFPIFTWVYTWERSKHKFFTAIGIIGFFFLCDLIAGAGGYLSLITSIGIIIWAIIDSATKPRSFYENYPNG